MNEKEKIKGLLESRKKLKKRLEKIEQIFREEKENEETWPGHSSTRYQTAESDRRFFGCPGEWQRPPVNIADDVKIHALTPVTGILVAR